MVVAGAPRAFARATRAQTIANARSATFASKKYKVFIPMVVACTAGGDVQEIAAWLERLGLGQYAQRFAENEVDLSVLPHLTDQDLRELDVPLGHRRKLLAAINE